MIYYAKSPKQDGTQETVQEHLQAVGQLAEIYGNFFQCGEVAKLCGLFHDFGKYSVDFQNVLNGTQERIDHAIGGAALFVFLFPKAFALNLPLKSPISKLFQPIMEAIAAHHSSLVSQNAMNTLLNTILLENKPVTTHNGKQAALCGAAAYQEAWKVFRSEFPKVQLPKPEVLRFLDESASQTVSMLYTRMLFSCLVDADYTASSDKPIGEGPKLNPSALLQTLYAHQKQLKMESTADSTLNQFRDQLFKRCGEAGEQDSGVFTLTAPTGTGKTLALLHFALRHCQHTGKRRIIVVLPFLSLIEQSTKNYRQIIPEIMEDHSQCNLPEDMKEHAARWDQPFIITTSVRFFETLFADQPTDCRKLHNLANSVILFDESQSLPLSLLGPTLQTVQELCRRYQCSMVFSTATQPDYTTFNTSFNKEQHKLFENFHWNSVELLPECQNFYEKLRRTEVCWNIDAPTALEEIADQMTSQQNVCAIINLRAHARKLYLALKDRCPEEELFLLSTDLCPEHRSDIIKVIQQRQKENLPCRVVSTQCIEAGVDLDFDRLYRALAPLEAIIQAAGRCNRNGKAAVGEVYVFIPDENRLYPDAVYENGVTAVRQMEQPINIHDPNCIRQYYKNLFGPFQGDKKSHNLNKAISLRDFGAVAKNYRLIEQRGIQILAPYEKQKKLYQDIRSEALKKGLTKALLHQAAPLMVTCYDQEAASHICEPLYFRESRDTSYYVLLPNKESCYDSKMGFCLPVEQRPQSHIW